MARSVHTPAVAPKRMPLFMALMGEKDSNTGTLVNAESASTQSAIHSFAWRGTGASRTSMPSLRRRASTPSSSRFTGQTQPQNARPRTSPYAASTGSAARSHSISNVFAAAIVSSIANGSSTSAPKIVVEERLPKNGRSAGVGRASSVPEPMPRSPQPATTSGAANRTRAPACTMRRATVQRRVCLFVALLIARRPDRATGRPRSSRTRG